MSYVLYIKIRSFTINTLSLLVAPLSQRQCLGCIVSSSTLIDIRGNVTPCTIVYRNCLCFQILSNGKNCTITRILSLMKLITMYSVYSLLHSLLFKKFQIYFCDLFGQFFVPWTTESCSSAFFTPDQTFNRLRFVCIIRMIISNYPSNTVLLLLFKILIHNLYNFSSKVGSLNK